MLEFCGLQMHRHNESCDRAMCYGTLNDSCGKSFKIKGGFAGIDAESVEMDPNGGIVLKQLSKMSSKSGSTTDTEALSSSGKPVPERTGVETAVDKGLDPDDTDNLRELRGGKNESELHEDVRERLGEVAEWTEFSRRSEVPEFCCLRFGRRAIFLWPCETGC